ncbi:zinc ribbon domain-containing protein [Lacticaseibacillus nasuensis]|uniref:Zinc-ribbon domain-containing protein n=1 Tax=Lacticaseibacillus nasuensis JCM 17158 TaxID=1291734 RepID=A0A0R1JSI3_9LACO|nr:zinc ribbon domain-containing protein [Lacticaseibacillus nasuensis]KRK74056.1 hypothetical protein FD02_GL001894 [Lacticaseibacillus nasuensis JCM 17158]
MITCPNCGQQIPADAEFCTFCGARLTPATTTSQAAPTPVQPPVAPATAQQATQQPQQQPIAPQPTPLPPTQPSAFSLFLKDYWHYLLDSIKHPATITRTYHKYAGLTSIGLTSLLVGLSFFTDNHRRYATAQLHQVISAGDSERGFATFFAWFLIMFCGILLYASTAHVVSGSLLGDKRADYLTGLNEFGHYSNLAVPVSVLFLLYALVGTQTGGYYVGVNVTLLTMVVLLVSIAATTTIYYTAIQTHLDRIYAFIVTHVVAILLIAVLCKLIYSMFADASSNNSFGPFS